MRHKISTSLGVMHTQLQDQDNEIFSGVGKGNVDSGIAWISTERIIFERF